MPCFIESITEIADIINNDTAIVTNNRWYLSNSRRNDRHTM